ncbi:putative receptor-like protein kinase At3g47110 [Prosopis cineraria]|uniref:putative receptor-like protein kinase At3g47110 n=1 Tax=Prosopis cineraria TaxID=364024 RepID=UPI002410AE3B|nr:putative receptor-like protein kinase At3g47110 [Prosopis cineraria]
MCIIFLDTQHFANFTKSDSLNVGKPPFLVSIFLFYCFMPSLAFIETNNTMDKSTLLALKTSITLDPYDFLANWSASSPPCNWAGVTCIIHHGRVHSLNLGGMGLRGTISPQLGHLLFLVELDLSNNSYYGQILEELVGLHRLKLFNLSYNYFTLMDNFQHG